MKKSVFRVCVSDHNDGISASEHKPVEVQQLSLQYVYHRDSWSFSKTVKSNTAGTCTLNNTAEVRDAVTNEWLDSDDESVAVVVHALTVTKTADVEWIRTFAWTIEKVAGPTVLYLFEGEEGTIGYTINVIRSVATTPTGSTET